MPSFPILLVAALAAYLLGSVSFALLSSRLFGLADPRTYGSRNPGATNVLRSGHKGAAIFTLLGDAVKGWFAVWFANGYSAAHGLGDMVMSVAAVAVFLGHLYPVFLKFRGGKGVATAAGVLLALDPWLGLATLATWLLIAFALRYSSLAALVAAAAAPIYATLLWGGDPKVATVGIIAMALIGKHWQNLQRLMAGAEPKIGAKK
ncbi:MAG TPA: glycerol-3-phosphate 1-O-acyltransferase PlsY [Accumulibacter sp.]|jgi:glycerol-3-phosphate acyltransferase PlsY|nr:glycerol-3-phosphate 1-O-acyltransferase PlsY [Accumulibacter sp.]